MNIPFTGFQATLIIWAGITIFIMLLVPYELENFAIVVFCMFLCLLIAVGIHDVSVYNDRDRWLKFREKERNG